jgi:hypothetical protein
VLAMILGLPILILVIVLVVLAIWASVNKRD